MLYSLKYLARRKRYQQKAAGTPVQPFYEQGFIKPSQLFTSTRFLVIDCEMSGLDVKTSQLLSIGWVMIEQGRIINASGRHQLIHAERGAGDSSIIHGLVDSNIAGASSAVSVLMLLIKQMQDAVLVFHHAKLDIKFLQKVALEHFRCPLLFPYLDTMIIEKHRSSLQGKTFGLRLAQCRQRYGLPSSTQHNALADAQATAELLLAQASYIGRPHNLKLSDLSLRCTG